MSLQERPSSEIKISGQEFKNGGNNGRTGVDILQLHMQDMTRFPMQIAEHPKWGKQIFEGQLALELLSEVVESDLLTIDQKDQISQLLGGERSQFLLSQFRLVLAIEQKKPASELAAAVKSDQSEFTDQLSEVKQIADGIIVEQKLQALIDQLDAKVSQSFKSFENLVNSNWRLALEWAWKKADSSSLDIKDLLYPAYMGLIIAAAKYDFRKGYQFSTYATWWIRSKINRAIADTNSIIRVPIHVQERVNRAIRRGEDDNEEVARIMGFRQTDSLSRLIDDQETEFGDLIPDPGEDTEENGLQEVFRERILIVMQKFLTHRQLKVLIWRLGFEDGRERSLEEIGQEMRVTRQRIQQIESEALKKLRQPEAVSMLRDLLENNSQVGVGNLL